MNQLTVGQFKAQFSKVLEKVKQGQVTTLTYGKNKKKVAALVPYDKYFAKKKFKLGLLDGKAHVKFHKDFKMTEEEFLRS